MTSTGFKDQGLPAPVLPTVDPTWEAVSKSLRDNYGIRF
jgi:hypothetical protein